MNFCLESASELARDDVATVMAAENVAARASWDAEDHLRSLYESEMRAQAARERN